MGDKHPTFSGNGLS